MTRADDLKNVSSTALWVAAMRAMESKRAPENRRCEDRYAEMLAGERGTLMLDAYFEIVHNARRQAGMDAVSSDEMNFTAIRTAAFDQAIAATLSGKVACTQAVILGSGMDTRAYRLPWPAGLKLFEVDYGNSLNYKETRLKKAGAQPSCVLTYVAADVAQEDWGEKLVAAGLQPQRPTLWVAEGLIYYLTAPAQQAFMLSIDRLSARDSVLLFDAFVDAQRLQDATHVGAFFARYGVAMHGTLGNNEKTLSSAGWHEVERLAAGGPTSLLAYSKK